MDYEITSHIDYITKSYQATDEPRDLIPIMGGFAIKKELGKKLQYEKAYLLECGGFLMTSTDPLQGSKIELSGKPLHELRTKWNFDDATLLAYLRSETHQKRTTRIDYAWNIKAGENITRQALEHWNSGKRITKIRKEPEIYAKNDPTSLNISPDGLSCYFGSKDAPTRVIVYDKAEEMGLLSEALTRVELRVKDNYAPLLASDMIKHGVLAAAQYKLASVLDFPALEWWQGLYTGEIVEMSPYKPGDKNFIKFLTGTVDPAIVKAVQDSHNAKEVLQYLARWANLIAELHPDIE